jgi:hypothetical protein
VKVGNEGKRAISNKAKQIAPWSRILPGKQIMTHVVKKFTDSY